MKFLFNFILRFDSHSSALYQTKVFKNVLYKLANNTRNGWKEVKFFEPKKCPHAPLSRAISPSPT